MMKKLKLFSLALMALFATSVWAKTWNVDLTGSGVSTDGITLTGAYIANAQVGSNSQKANSLQAKTSSVCVFSENTNITGISFKVCRATNGNSATKAVSIYTAKGGVYSLPAENTFAATNNSSSITSLYQITAVGNNQANANSVSVTFNSPVKAIELRYEDSNGANIHDISIIYNEATTPTTLLNAVIAGSTPAATVTPDGAAITLSVNSSSPKTIGSNKFYQWNSGNTLDLGTGKKFKVGDQIIADVCASGDKKGVGFKLDGGDTDYIVYLNASVNAEVCYTVTKDDGVEGQQTVTLKRKGSDTYVHSFRVLRPITYTVTYKANGGAGDDIEDESATAVAANSFTYEGYRFMGWNTDAEGNGTAYAVNANVTDNLTLYAQWSQEYSVSYANTGAASGSAPTNDNKYIKDETFEVAGVGTMVAATGKTFRSWSDGVNTYVEGDTYTIGTSNVSFTPIWVDVYDVTFDKGAATGTAPAAFQKWEGAKFNLPGQGEMVAPDGKVFDGWKANGSGDLLEEDDEYTMTAADVEFVAQWIDTYTVTYKANGGTGEDVVRNNPATIEDNMFTAPSKKVFANWNTQADGEGTTYEADDAVSTTLILFAQWEDIPCPTSGTVFSAKVAATSPQSIAAGASNLALTASQATVTGGSMSVFNGQTSAKDLIAASSKVYYFTETNDNTFFKLTLDCPIQAGDTIKIDGIGGTREKNEVTYELGLWVSTASSKPGSAPACAGTSSTASLVTNMVNYVVTASDEYKEQDVLYIYRAYGATQYFDNIRIIRPAKYAVTVSAPTNGTLAVKKGGVAITSGDQIIKGSTLTVEATPSKDYTLNAIKVIKTGVEPEEDVTTTVLDGTTLTVPAYAVTVSATFTYTGGGTGFDNTAEEVKAVKRIENGMLIIEKNGKTYNAQGQMIK